MKHEIVFSYLAISLLKQVKNISEDGIVYKFFKTTNEIIKTQHTLHNYNKTYSAQKTFFGYQQIVVNSREGIAIMNDAKYLSYVSIQITGFALQVAGKIIHRDLADGSSFTANDIHYVVRT